ncbi:Uu.00g028960.m01.CDS01 [Anthostomella pinea]|uniref:Uu.00g028960.m01.CDS01 n=1 Tax=Anthostomella pinea TaxID=933095 RepID=A0AAI8YCZ4_9PEZI|nr:Uu.00g028960.m01.CDS01 [Anthostomella pinea]
MRLSAVCCLQILSATAFAHVATRPNGIRSESDPQLPLMPALPPSKPSDPQQSQPPPQGRVLISDVMGRDRSINIFASFTRDIASISSRLDSSLENSTVLAPLNSAVERLPRKPWEDPREYDAFGANAYEGGDGKDRAQRNLRRFVEAHVVPASPWAEKEKVKSLLDGDREIWWEMKDGVKVIKPDDIEVQSIASRVGNGEVWILKETRNYA